MNTFMGLGLADRVPEELWIEVHNLVQEAVTKTIPKKKKCKKAKWLSEKFLQIAEERREIKSRGERERYAQLNENSREFQRIARRDKAFLNEKCKEIEENNRMGKTRDCFKKFGDTKGQRRQWKPTPVLLPGKSHGRRSLVGCSPWGREESESTTRHNFHFSLSCTGEGNDNPLQCSCLENPRDGEPGGLPSMESHRVGYD